MEKKIEVLLKAFEEKKMFITTREHNRISEERLEAFTNSTHDLILKLLRENEILRQELGIEDPEEKWEPETNVFKCISCHRSLACYADYTCKDWDKRMNHFNHISWLDETKQGCKCSTIKRVQCLNEVHYAIPWTSVYFWDGKYNERAEDIKLPTN